MAALDGVDDGDDPVVVGLAELVGRPHDPGKLAGAVRDLREPVLHARKFVHAMETLAG